MALEPSGVAKWITWNLWSASEPNGRSGEDSWRKSPNTSLASSVQQALEDLKSAQEQVIQQERLRALGGMASGIAHDFNNSLVGILGLTELLLQRPENLDDKAKARRYLEMINTSAKDAGKIVNRLREFYRFRDQARPWRRSISIGSLTKPSR
jgi:signal transduction histidine kinase